MTERRLGWWIFLIAAIIRLGFALPGGIDRPTDAGTDQAEYDQYAWNLAQGNGYRGASPDVADQNHLTAYRAPGPSLVWAALYRVGGHHPALVRIANALFGAVSCLLIVALGVRCFDRRIGLAAAAVWAVWPVSIFVSPTLLSEPLAIVCFLALLIVLLDFALRPSLLLALLSGLGLGVNLLVHPSRLFFIPMLGIWALVQFRRAPRTLLLSAVIPLVGALCMAPWIVRNYHVFGRLIPFSTMGGSVLLQGNNRIVAENPEYWGYNVWDTDIPEDRELLKAPNNEVGRDSVAKQLAMAWLKTNPGKILPMTIKKIARGWTPLLQSKTALSLRLIMFLSWGPVLLLTLIGVGPSLVLFLRSGHPGWILHMAILHVIAIHAVFFGYARYRLLAEPACLLIAAFAATWLAGRAGKPAWLLPRSGKTTEPAHPT